MDFRHDNYFWHGNVTGKLAEILHDKLYLLRLKKMDSECYDFDDMIWGMKLFFKDEEVIELLKNSNDKFVFKNIVEKSTDEDEITTITFEYKTNPSYCVDMKIESKTIEEFI